MNRNIIRFPRFFVLALAFMSVSTMAQATSSTTREKFQSSLTFTACNGEDVALEVATTIVMHMSVSNSGRVNFKIAVTEHATGVGQTTGAKYVGNSTQEINEHYDGNDSVPYNFTFPSHLNLNGRGSVENLRAKDLIHITVNANGDITSFKQETRAECN